MNNIDLENLWHLSYLPDLLKNILFSIFMIFFSKEVKKDSKSNNNIPFLDMI
jgi:hypothetical protein